MDQSSLIQKVVQCAKDAAQRSGNLNIADLWERLAHMDVKDVQQKIEKSRPFGWYGAVPSEEPVDLIKTSNAIPVPCAGVDGSQIYPLPESPVQFAYAQSVYFASGDKPIYESQFVSLVDLAAEETNYSLWISPGQVDNLRTLLELKAAYSAAQKNPESVILMDNPLVPFENYGQSQNQWFREYTSQIQKLEGKRFVGYVSNPKSRLLMNLIEIAEPSGELPQEFRFIDDWILTQKILKPGQRTALFAHGSRRNLAMEQAGFQIFFSYLKINQDELARFEIAEPIAQRSTEVDIIQSSIIHDCRLLGYPYVLAMAHKQVAINPSIGEELNQLALRTFTENGGCFRSSAKSRVKGW